MGFPSFPASLGLIDPVIAEITPPDYGCPACGYALIDEVVDDIHARLHLDGKYTDREPLEYYSECPECQAPVRVQLRIHVTILGIKMYQVELMPTGNS